MGKTITPKYRVVALDNFGKRQEFCWSGHATEKRLKEWRDRMNKSFRAGGTNEHVSREVGYVVQYGRCWIERNVPGGNKVVEFKPPMFEMMD